MTELIRNGKTYVLKPHEVLLWGLIAKDERRSSHEWAAWDGTPEHAEMIVDQQSARMRAMREKIGDWSPEWVDFISHCQPKLA